MMSETKDILGDIEQAILARLKAKGLGFFEASVTDDKGVPLNSPAVHVEISRGEFSPIGSGESKAYRMNLTIGLVIFLRTLGFTDKDLELLHSLQMGVTQVLMNWPKLEERTALNLDIKPLEPVSWENATTDDWWEKGIRVFICVFKSAIEVSEPTEADLGEISKFGVKLIYKPGDDVPDMTVKIPRQEE